MWMGLDNMPYWSYSIDQGDTWSNATISAAGALIYNSSQSNKAIAVISFGGTVASTAGDFTVSFPAADASNAIVRIA